MPHTSSNPNYQILWGNTSSFHPYKQHHSSKHSEISHMYQQQCHRIITLNLMKILYRNQTYLQVFCYSVGFFYHVICSFYVMSVWRGI